MPTLRMQPGYDHSYFFISTFMEGTTSRSMPTPCMRDRPGTIDRASISTLMPAPVKAEAERVATRHKVRMYVVSNGGLRPSQNPLVETVIVPDGPDIADNLDRRPLRPWRCGGHGDIPLAARCVEAGARVLKTQRRSADLGQ